MIKKSIDADTNWTRVDEGRRRLFRVAGFAALASLLPKASFAAVENPAISPDTPIRGGTLVAIAYPEPPTLASHLNGANPISLITSKIFDRLFINANDGSLLPRLGQSLETSKDGLTIKLTLRKGVTWHDGHPFASDDVKYSIEKIWLRNPNSNFAVIDKITTPDSHTVLLHLKEKWPILIQYLGNSAGAILPRHLHENVDLVTNPYNVKPIGTGPFKFKDWQRGSHIVLERNPNYYLEGRPYLDRVVFKVINDSASRAAALETDAAHYAVRNPVTFSDAARLQKLPNVVLDTRQYEPSSFWIEFNLRDPIMAKVKVRQAIAHAIDKATLVKTVWGGYGTPMEGPVPSAFKQYFTKDVPTYPFDPERANKLLDEAGYPRKADGWRFKLVHDFIPFGDDYRRTGEFVRQALRKVGIDVSLGSKDLSTWSREVFTNHNFQMISSWSGWSTDPQQGLETRYAERGERVGVPWTKASGYKNAEVDKLLDATRSGDNLPLRVINYKKVQQIVQADLPMVYLFEVKWFSIASKRLQNIAEFPSQTRNNFANVWLSKN